MAASLWIDFLNSDWHDPLGQAPGRNRLHEPQWLQKFLATWKLPEVDGPTEPARSRLVDIRTALQGLVAAMVRGRGLRPADLEVLNRSLEGVPVTMRCVVEGTSARLRIVPAAGAAGLDAVVLAIVESFAAFLAEGD